ncbi:MAG: serine protease, partial [Bradyrhizobium sp.]|nr:serine protease [Bradyrhizobium sp.]
MRLYVLYSLAAVLASQSLVGQSAMPLTAFSQSLEALAARVDPAVVQIVSTGYGRGDESQRGSASLLTRQRSTGSGVILAADGYIV